MAGQSDDRNAPLGEDLARGLDSVEPRQPEVEQDDVGLVLACELDGLDAVARVGDDFEPCVLEYEPQVRSRDRIVLHGQYGCGNAWHGVPPSSEKRKAAGLSPAASKPNRPPFSTIGPWIVARRGGGTEANVAALAGVRRRARYARPVRRSYPGVKPTNRGKQ